MSEPVLTKRLHISGLTPSITATDIERRLSLFGKVTAMDGFGKRDALGDPRKFGFVTMEIGAKELAKCLNVLSGSTWKGAKLRIGEAKPDFRERLAHINSRPPPPVRPKRTHSHNHGYSSPILPSSPLSAAAAASTPGWIVTPSGRVVRPMRMRPDRPLEPIRSETSVLKAKGMNGKVKKRVKPPPVRARRRLIDPTKWDSVYLKGVFLDAVSVTLSVSNDAPEPSGPVKYDIVEEEEEEETEDGGTDNNAVSSVVQEEAQSPQDASQLLQNRASAVPNAQRSQDAVLAAPSPMHEATEADDIRDETNAALAMLGEMFEDGGDWGGRECVSEMDDLDSDEVRGKGMQANGVDDIEIVPRDFRVGAGTVVAKKDKGKGKEQMLEAAPVGGVGVGLEVIRDADVEMYGPPAIVGVLAQTAEPLPSTNLKALFAPREEASFSLLDHLDLDHDLELDADILGMNALPSAPQKNDHTSEPITPTFHVTQIPTTLKARSRVTLDPSLPLLFPPSDSLPHPPTPSGPSATLHRHDVPTCFLFPSATRTRGLYYLPPSITFTRSPEDTPESIRERWEKDKLSLTREWKKAWREARGSRRRAGAGGEVGGNY